MAVPYFSLLFGHVKKNTPNQKIVTSRKSILFLRSLLLVFPVSENLNEQTRRQKAGWSIALVCVGALILTTSASYSFFPNFLRYTACSVGGLLLLGGLFVLSWIDQDDARHSFGHSGGFICPFVPFLPVCCILINAYLLVNLSVGTWFRVSLWLLLGVIVYVLYGRTHSSLSDVVYVPAAHADEVFRTSGCVA